MSATVTPEPTRLSPDPSAASDPPAHFDEMVTGAGQVRPHWRALLSAYSGLQEGAFAERAERARAQLDDEGIAAIDAGGQTATGGLDLFPLLLPADEWATLERGVRDRAQLLEAVLADLYGPQRLLAERAIPPALVYGNPEFLRPCRSAEPRSAEPRSAEPRVRPGPFLHLYAIDLARGPDGTWRVLADRTQAPAGLGYALANRRIAGRTLPEMTRAAAVRRLGPFVDLWFATLRGLGHPLGGDNPRVVLLSAGPGSETYVELVYLARELGIPVIEGADLTVRDGRVHLKTLAGLEPVHVLYRRFDAAFCDPLELRADSVLGVAGLTHAVRQGHVVVANALGSALLESPAFAPYLLAAAATLGLPAPELAAVPTRWCGEPQHREAVLAALRGDPGSLWLAPAFVPEAGLQDPCGIPATGISLASRDAAARDALADAIGADPRGWVAREAAMASVAPSWGQGGLAPQPVVLRVFALNTPHGFAVMPGGLARVVEDRNPFFLALRRGGLAKDVWVLSEDRAERAAMGSLFAAAPLALRRSGELESRVGDTLFWLGRYIERIDGGARLLRAALARLAQDAPGPRDLSEIAALARCAELARLIDPQAAAAPPHSRMLAVALAGAAMPRRALMGTFAAARRLADAARDRVSADMWHTLCHLTQDGREQLEAAAGNVDATLSALDAVIRAGAAIGGMVSENMTRSSLWRFLEIGRRLERAVATVRSMVSLLEGPSPDTALRLMLELADSTITYRTRYRAALQPVPVLDLVLTDESNPRALAYQLEAIAAHLRALPGGESGALALRVEMALDATRMALEAEEAGGGDTAPLIATLRTVDMGLMQLSEALTRHYFSHVKPAHALAPGHSAPDAAATPAPELRASA